MAVGLNETAIDHHRGQRHEGGRASDDQARSITPLAPAASRPTPGEQGEGQRQREQRERRRPRAS